MSGYAYLIGTVLLIAALNGFVLWGTGGLVPDYLYVVNFVMPFAAPLLLWLVFALPRRLRVFASRRAELPQVLAYVEDEVIAHRLSLKKRLDAAVTRNIFGWIKSDGRKAVWAAFFKAEQIDTKRFPEVWAHAETVLREVSRVDARTGFDPNHLPEDGHEFEHWVAQALQLYGWTAQVTTGSGDQGIDVIAERGGKRLGIQCKLYRSNVGNKAVQEVFAGKTHYQLDDGAVLTNAQFTQAARRLAQSTGTLLLSPYDIPNLHEKLEGY